MFNPIFELFDQKFQPHIVPIFHKFWFSSLDNNPIQAMLKRQGLISIWNRIWFLLCCLSEVELIRFEFQIKPKLM